jgi:Tfp pilus assembly ATPase PilU
MVSNARIADLIRERRTEDIPEAMEEGEFYQMQTFSKALLGLVLSGMVDRETAANAASNRHDFLVTLEHAERTANVAAAETGRGVETPGLHSKDESLPTLRVAGG